MNYYEILKVPKSASNEQIKSSYKTLVKQYHPDLYVGDKDFAEQKIKEINEAYDVLSDAQKKFEYDEYLASLSNPTIPYTTSVESNFSNDFNHSNPEQTQGFFTKLILEKINKLDKKRQLQIFILILVLFLSFFLINIIQVQYYLNNQGNKTSNSMNPSNIIEDNFSDFPTPSFEDEAFYNETDLKTLDDLFYELFSPYFSEEPNLDYDLENN